MGYCIFPQNLSLLMRIEMSHLEFKLNLLTSFWFCILRFVFWGITQQPFFRILHLLLVEVFGCFNGNGNVLPGIQTQSPHQLLGRGRKSILLCLQYGMNCLTKLVFRSNKNQIIKTKRSQSFWFYDFSDYFFLMWIYELML